jgi:hypothetical protein
MLLWPPIRSSAPPLSRGTRGGCRGRGIERIGRAGFCDQQAERAWLTTAVSAAERSGVVGGGGGGGGVGNLEAGAATPSSLCPFPSSAACQAEDQRRLFPSHDFFLEQL